MGLVIDGPQTLRGAQLDSETDHRVAMSLAMAALNAQGPSRIQGADAAGVSYPDFWRQLGRLQATTGGVMEEDVPPIPPTHAGH